MNGCFVLKADKYCKRDKLWILSENKRKTRLLNKVEVGVGAQRLPRLAIEM